ncbi:hypothetical protein GGF46_000927 [Coemansia sp. RSA 552]|nr:hypothetical protein GGF46_000927 [Coemansia sp. RSA 552]
MAWMCSGRTNNELVDKLLKGGVIESDRVVSAMRAADRGHFSSHYPYQDSPQSIGYGATISAPHMHGYALESLQDYLRPGMHALDVGSGSGYLTACMAAMVGENGKVVGIDHIPELVESSQEVFDEHYPKWIESARVKVVAGDGRKGYPDDGPYDCIHVGAASPGRPLELIHQLKSPGRLFVPVGTASQHIVVYDKDSSGNVKEKRIMDVRYVPLTNPDIQLDG